VRWVIVIERDGKAVGKEEVRGWGRSGRRIQEIAELAAAGTWQPAPARPDEWDNRFTRWLYRSCGVPFPGEEGETDGSRPPATPGEPTRCVLHPIAAFGSWDRPMPALAIDVGKDTIWVIELNTNTLIASAWLAQVTATPANHHSAGPVLVVGVPSLPTPMIIRPPKHAWWRGKVAKTRGPVYLVAEQEEWLTLVEKLGLTPSLSGLGSRP
jgi:hypothetical protein